MTILYYIKLIRSVQSFSNLNNLIYNVFFLNIRACLVQLKTFISPFTIKVIAYN